MADVEVAQKVRNPHDRILLGMDGVYQSARDQTVHLSLVDVAAVDRPETNSHPLPCGYVHLDDRVLRWPVGTLWQSDLTRVCRRSMTGSCIRLKSQAMIFLKFYSVGTR